ncbi:hypothetical protein [Lactococcus lactis]|uniref:hypothetical protein n=1 Tax=Lactococcus lactis TaxID=1358 RepID=UPI0013D4B08E|nr:hypothetical protein [Lactococcus lactis]
MENQEILVPVKRFIEEGLNKGNVDIIREVWAKDMLWEGAPWVPSMAWTTLPIMVFKPLVICI